MKRTRVVHAFVAQERARSLMENLTIAERHLIVEALNSHALAHSHAGKADTAEELSRLAAIFCGAKARAD